MRIASAALVAALAWQPHVKPRVAPSQRAAAPIMQAGNPAALKAFEMLGKMGLQAATEATPGVAPETKEFVASATIKHNRVMLPVDGGAIVDYMRLPVSEYAIYDDRLMRKLPTDGSDGGDGEIFELSVPTMRPKEGTFVPKPKVKVRVIPEADRITLRSIGASFFGDVEKLPPNVTAAQLEAANEQFKDSFDLALNTTLAWSEARKDGPGATRLKCRTDVRLKVQLPAPFTRAPRPLVQGAIGLVMKVVGNAILPRFASLLEGDYQRWCNGTREMAGLGSLTLDDEGYVVVPKAVLEQIQNAPGGRDRLAAAGATLDFENNGSSDGLAGTASSAVVVEGEGSADGDTDEGSANPASGTAGQVRTQGRGAGEPEPRRKR